MDVWALDFRARTAQAVAAGDVADLRAAGRFCWLDLDAREDPAEILAELVRDVPEGFGRRVLRDLAFADGWLAFGLEEPRAGVAVDGAGDAALAQVGLNVLFSGSLLVTLDFGLAHTLMRLRSTWQDDFRQHARSPGFFLFEIADHFTSAAQRQVHVMERQVSPLQARLFADVQDEVFAETAAVVQRLGDFRHRLIMAHEIFDELATRASAFVPETTRPFLARSADRVERTAGELQTLSDGLMSALSLCIGMNGHRTGELLKRLTGFSMIFLPLSFLAGVFGMNFASLPGQHGQWAFAAFCGLCVAVTTALLVVARRSRWF